MLICQLSNLGKGVETLAMAVPSDLSIAHQPDTKHEPERVCPPAKTPKRLDGSSKREGGGSRHWPPPGRLSYCLNIAGNTSREPASHMDSEWGHRERTPARPTQEIDKCTIIGANRAVGTLERRSRSPLVHRRSDAS